MSRSSVQSPAVLKRPDGADLVGFVHEGIDPVPRAVSERLRESLSVKDFGASGVGVGDDTDGIKAAIFAAEFFGSGRGVKFPQGTYLISETIRVKKGIYIEGEGFGDESSAASPNDALTRIKWIAGSGALPMIVFKSDTVGNRIFYGGITGLTLDGNNEAQLGLKLASTQGTRIGVLFTYRTVSWGTVINNENGALNSNCNIGTLRHFNGAGAEVINCSGLFIDGDQHASGATSVMCNEYEGEYQDGDALIFRGVDTCNFARVRCIDRGGSHLFGGSANGYGVRFKRSAVSLHAQKNYIGHLGRGTVYVEDNTIGNRIGFFNGEGGAIQYEGGASGFDPGTLSYRCVDRIHGDEFETHVWAMQQRVDVAVASMLPSEGNPVLSTAGAFPVPYYSFGPGVNESIVGVLAPPDKWNNGAVVGFRLGLVPVGSSSPNNDVVIRLKMSVVGDGIGPGVGELSEQFTFTISSSTTVIDVFEQLFLSSLSYSRDDTIVISVARLGPDVADTFPNDVGVAWLQLLYESDGPDSAGSGPWEVPVRNLD